MTEPGVGAQTLDLSMSVVGYEVAYGRSATDQSPTDFASGVSLTLSVKGAMVEHHQNAPVKRVIVDLSDRAVASGKLGHLRRAGGEGAAIHINLPGSDFAAIWAALRLDRVATLECTIVRPADDVTSFSIRSQGSLFPLFGV